MEKETLNVNGLLISKILANNVTYDKAKTILAAAGHGWRIPTLAEFCEILEREGVDALAEWLGTKTPTMTDIFVQSFDRQDDVNTISIDGRHLACNVCNAAKERGMSDWYADVVLVKTDISTRAYNVASRLANDAVKEIRYLLESHNVKSLDFDAYRGKCRVEDYDYIVQNDDYDRNALCGITMTESGNIYLLDANGNDDIIDGFRCDLEIDIYELVKTIMDLVDNGELELHEYLSE